MGKTTIVGKNEVTEYLNDLVVAVKGIRRLADKQLHLDESTILEAICCFDHRGKSVFHLYSGVRKTAEIMGLPVKETFRDDNKYPIEVSFDYNGVTFFELETPSAKEEA